MVAILIANAAWWALRVGGTIGKALGNIVHERTRAFPGQTPEMRLRAQEQLGGFSGAVAGTVRWIRERAYTEPKEVVVDTVATVTALKALQLGFTVPARIGTVLGVRGVGVGIPGIAAFGEALATGFPENVLTSGIRGYLAGVEAGEEIRREFLPPTERVIKETFDLAGDVRNLTEALWRAPTALPGAVDSLVENSGQLLQAIGNWWGIVEPAIPEVLPTPVRDVFPHLAGIVIPWWKMTQTELEDRLPPAARPPAARPPAVEPDAPPAVPPPVIHLPPPVVQEKFFEMVPGLLRSIGPAISDVRRIIDLLKTPL